MKYITLIIGLLVAGCGKQEQTDTNESTLSTNTNKVNGTTAKPENELTLEEKIVGTYEKKFDEGTMKLVFLGNGTVEKYKNGEKTDDFEWKIVGKEVHLGDGMPPVSVGKIEPNGDLTTIAEIDGGGRKDSSKEDQMTFKKIKADEKSPAKKLTPQEKQKALRDSVLGKWDGGVFILLFDKDGTVEALEEGVTVDTGTWTIKDGKVHTVNSGKFGQRGSVVIYEMNEEGNLQHPLGFELKNLD
jgi:hypothetical protein|tara:strand:+ start:181 stop:909 length:729 start_codon:yes stop_codon:yes gene_type:complete